MNGSLSILSIVVAILIKQDSTFLIINPVMTLALISCCSIFGGTLGACLSMTLFQNCDLSLLIRLQTLGLPLLFISLYTHWIFGVYLSLGMLMIVSGMLNPKFQALLMNSFPEERLALLMSGIMTLFQIGTFICRGIVAVLIVWLLVDWISLSFLLISILLTLYTFKTLQRVNSSPY
ncbi:hypothetical protein [Streptococcus ictaluri]|uniref:hypothetical protein n=1 Tax=Streptococcus ictaluri TaxID=380397 RepID=UPI001F2BBF46|nr:hypothetical protein [Streptococcus ictaluri]